MTYGHKCDRCEEWGGGEPYRGIDVDSKPLEREEAWLMHEHDYHLCETCWEKFESFMNGGRVTDVSDTAADDKTTVTGGDVPDHSDQL